jgi:CubicO group peptidase (beta-lactamase class C family)
MTNQQIVPMNAGSLVLAIRVVALLFLICVVSPAARAAPQPDRLDVYMNSKMKELRIPGAQVAIVKGRQIVALRTYGLANVADHLPVTNQTAFSIASITKAFAGVAAMQLVEQGKLDLSDPVSRYVDDLPQAWRAVTIRELFTGLSGIPDLWENINVIATDEEVAWAKVKAMPMLAKPGERFRYTQTNYVLLAKVIEKASGMPFTRFVEVNQLNVVHMPRTLFAYSSNAPDNSAGRYTYFEVAGSEIRTTDTLMNRREDNPSWFAICNGLMATAGDLARWIIALNHGELLKQPGSLAALWTPGILNSGIQSEGFGGLLNGYALGWETVTRPKHPAVAAVGGDRAALFVYRDDALAVVVLTNLWGPRPPNLWIDDIAALYLQEKPQGNVAAP